MKHIKYLAVGLLFLAVVFAVWVTLSEIGIVILIIILIGISAYWLGQAILK